MAGEKKTLRLRSTVTKKGQTTIPAKIRKALKLRAGDAVKYELNRGQVILEPVRGSILDAAGSVAPRRRPEDFKKMRQKTKKAVADRAVGKTK